MMWGEFPNSGQEKGAAARHRHCTDRRTMPSTACMGWLCRPREQLAGKGAQPEERWVRCSWVKATWTISRGAGLGFRAVPASLARPCKVHLSFITDCTRHPKSSNKFTASALLSNTGLNQRHAFPGSADKVCIAACIYGHFSTWQEPRKEQSASCEQAQGTGFPGCTVLSIA